MPAREPDLGPVVQPITVGVGIGRIRRTESRQRSEPRHLVAVVDPIVVGVGVERVGLAGSDFTIPVRIFLNVWQTVTVRVHVHGVIGGFEGIGLTWVELTVAVGVLNPVGDAAVVGVAVRRIGHCRALVRVRNKHRDVGVVSLRLEQAGLGAVLYTISIGVGLVRIGLAVARCTGPSEGAVDRAVGVFVLGSVEEAIVVGVVIERIGCGARIGVGHEHGRVGVNTRGHNAHFGAILDPIPV